MLSKAWVTPGGPQVPGGNPSEASGNPMDRGSSYTMGLRIGAVDPATQWAFLIGAVDPATQWAFWIGAVDPST